VRHFTLPQNRVKASFKMYKPLLLIIATLYNLLCNAQDKITIHQPYKGRVVYPIQTIEINTLSQLPTKHQFIINTVINESMTDFKNNIVFVKGQMIDVENWFSKDSVPQTEYRYIIPTYQLVFELRDTSVGIIKYAFELSLDKYGQVIKFDWPRAGYDKRVNFLKTDLVLQHAINYAKSKGYNTDVRVFHLQYNRHYKKLCWTISFLQNTEGNVRENLKLYKAITIDVKHLKVLEETEMFESYRSH
jgi:hypothetical protein